MTTNKRITSGLIALVTLLAASRSTYAVSNLYIGPTGAETGLNNPDCNWQNMWGPAFVSMAFDATTVDTLASADPNGDSSGSIYMQASWSGTAAGDDYNLAAAGNWYRGTVFDATKYASIEMDFKYDTNSTITPTNAPHLDIGFDGGGGYSSQVMETIHITNGAGVADGNWHHLHIPYSATSVNPSVWSAIATSGGVSWYQWNPSNTVGTMNYWMANIYLVANVAPAAPPTLSINKSIPGLHFVEGSISGQYDRQNITTANGVNSTSNYFWGNATSGNPVTYSFNISQFTAPDLNYHSYFYNTTGAGGASAPDYNQPNVLIFQVSPTSNNTASIASLTWKTNTPSAGTTGTALQITNAQLTGLWQAEFTSSTGGNVIAPDSTQYPFTLDAGLVNNLSNGGPITVNFGINPASAASTIVGEEVVVSKISITGADQLSIDASNTDNFLADPALDTNTWTVNALYSPSVMFVGTNIAYSVNWNVPDGGFALAAASDLLSLGSGVNLDLPTIALTPGKRSLVPKTSLPVGSQGYFYLINRPPSQLMVVLPGQTLAPGQPGGVSGTPTPVSLSNNAGEEAVTVYVADSAFNPITGSYDSITITCATDADFIANNPFSLNNGTVTANVFFNDMTGTNTITVTDATTGFTGTSSPVVVGP